MLVEYEPNHGWFSKWCKKRHHPIPLSRETMWHTMSGNHHKCWKKKNKKSTSFSPLLFAGQTTWVPLQIYIYSKVIAMKTCHIKKKIILLENPGAGSVLNWKLVSLLKTGHVYMHTEMWTRLFKIFTERKIPSVEKLTV